METEAETIRRWKEGDTDAFDTIYERYKQDAMRTAWLLCKNYADSEDIVQETFIQCHLHIKELKDENCFKGWMLRILIRYGWKEQKKQSRERPEEEMKLRARQFETASFVSGESGPLETALKKEEEGELLKAVGFLPEKQRVAVVLYYYDELSVGEIARVTGCLPGTVKSRLYFARKQLKRYYVQKEGAYEKRPI